MRVRYKKTGAHAEASHFNLIGIDEVLTGDDSVPVSELNVWLPALGTWKPMDQAFRDGDLITDNHNTTFFEPQTTVDRERGYTLQ